MKFATYELNGKTGICIVSSDNDKILPIQEAEKKYLGTNELPNTMLDFLDMGVKALAICEKIVYKCDCSIAIPLEQVMLLAPIPRTRKNIFCVGKNYVEHALEFEKTKDVNVAVPKVPVIFSKPPTSIVGPNAIVKNHKHATSKLDYEVELAVVIGKKGFNIPKEQAYDYVFGYTILNDVSARDLQKEHAQWIMGKGLDTFAPMGPWIVDKKEIGNPHDLEIKCSINGELRQNSNTKLMVFDIPTLINTISSVMTLEPGDIIATGTPSGVGVGFEPPKLMNHGDQMVCEIEKIGKLINTIEK